MQKGESCLRVLICTNAFGMGIDCKAVHNVVHWGPPEEIEHMFKRLAEEAEPIL